MAVHKRQIILPFVIILFALFILVVLSSMRPQPMRGQPPRPAVLVEVVEVEKKDETFVVDGYGTVNPRYQTQIVTEVSGRVVRISEKFVAGGFFQEGEVLLEIDPSDYEANLEDARANVARAQSSLATERALGRVAEAEWRSIEAGEIPELGLRQPQLASELANLRAAEAQLDRAERNLERTVVRAPFSGLLQAKQANLGQYLGVGTSIGMFYGTEVAEVRVPLTDYDLSFLDQQMINSETSAGPSVSVTAEVAGEFRSWQGHLVRTEGVLDPTSRVIYGVVEIQDPYNREHRTHETPLQFGRFVTANVEGVTVQGLIELPRHAINTNGEVWVVTEERLLERREVVSYRLDEQTVFVSSGLENGELVMTTQLDNPLPGMKVRLPGDPLIPQEEAAEPEAENGEEG
ncbi:MULTISPECIES: efflux RND transporter periplasmic adaptor subunit [Gammaproteobacteria]|uniref:efflux RND transporter periplasmic adaptor subunit n=1 Tax=Gammaproteobacteria TaxID=1236 RepID=UPI000DD06A2F|nr:MULTISPECIES: efflux RND transporter periplasmic adaptor subunit [Gammaproteobacteria]RTE87508.1 efflux RND transporter periplasmic adaptor subunit [Aliidiomarina sp. B3213]TCZ92707.1 efflux RND transporter periplasmic adaptor subunit [Lysobacter sp. N42]